MNSFSISGYQGSETRLATARAGSVLQIEGAGFDAPQVAVFWGDRCLPILAQEPDRLAVRLPALSVGFVAPISVRLPDRRAVGPLLYLRSAGMGG